MIGHVILFWKEAYILFLHYDTIDETIKDKILIISLCVASSGMQITGCSMILPIRRQVLSDCSIYCPGIWTNWRGKQLCVDTSFLCCDHN
jgi:hypothetical protein